MKFEKLKSHKIFDEKGQLINSFTNETKDEIDKSEYDMQLSRFTVIKTSNVTLNKGFNRFRWNLKHQGILGKKKGKNLTGPLVKPGTYKVQITLDGQQTLTDEIVVLKDPKTDTSEIALGELEDFQLKLLDKIGEVNQLAEEMKTSIAKIKSKKRKTALLQSTLEQLETQEGTYMQPMLIDQLRYLYSMTTRADQILGQDAYDRYAELK